MERPFAYTLRISLILISSCLLVGSFALFLVHRHESELLTRGLITVVKHQAAVLNHVTHAVNARSGKLLNPDSLRALRRDITDGFVFHDKTATPYGMKTQIVVGELLGDSLFMRLTVPETGEVRSVPFHGQLAEPMRRALSGCSGLTEALDYRGIRVLAAYEPVPSLGLGLVAKMDMSEVRAPYNRFVRWLVALVALTTVIGVYLILRVTRPVISRLKAQNRTLQAEIASRNQLERALSAAGQSYRDLVERISDTVYEINASGVVSYISPVVSNVLGYEPAEVQGKPFRSLVHLEDLEAVEAQFRSTLNGKSYPEEFRLSTVYGGWRWVRSSAQPVTDGTAVSGVRGVFVDVTAQKAAEQALLESERITRTIATAARDAVILIDSAGAVHYWNPAAQKIFGYTADEATGQLVHDLIAPPELRGQVGDCMSCFAATGNGPAVGKTLELVARRKNGTTVPVELSLAATKLQGAWWAVGIVRDISERNRSQDALRKLQSAVEKSGEIIFMTDREGVFTYVNPAFTRLYGYPSEEVVGKATPRILKSGEISVDVYKELWTTLLAKQIYRNELVNHTRDGRRITVEVAVSPTLDESGGIEGFLAVQRDVSDRKQAELALRESEARFRMVAESLNEGLVITDLDENILYVNPQLANMCGCTVDELIGGSTDIIIPPELREATHIRTLRRKQGMSEKYELQLQKKNGERFWVEVNAGPYMDARGNIVGSLAAIADISNRKAAELERNKLESQLRQAQKMEAIGTLAGGIAHDFNNILTPIMAYTDMILARGASDPVTKQDLTRVMQAALRARDLVRQILTFSRQTEHERLPLSPAPIIKEALKLLRASLPSTIQIVENIQNNTREIVADPTQIHQVMMNLCTNAGWAMRENGGTLEVSLEDVEVSPAGGDGQARMPVGRYAKLTVRDTGCGMDAHTLSRVFEPFFTTKAVGEGTGLGLPVVHGIVRSCGGEIFVTSEPGVGTRVDVFFPQAEIVRPPEAQSAMGAVNGNERILLVDDEPEIAAGCARSLERFGYRVTSRASSVEALEAFKARAVEYDLVITDCTMPHLTGFQLARLIREVRPELPIIMMTGFSATINQENIRELGIQAIVMKPVIGQDLAATIRRVVDSPPDHSLRDQVSG